MTEPEHWPDWNLHASVIMGLAVLGGLYVSWGGLAAARRRVLCFGAALALLFLSLNGPLHNLSDCCLFSAHMVQHLLLTLAFPPLLLYGTPAWVIRPLLKPRVLFRFAAWATRPLPAAVIFSTPITAWHFPGAYEAALEHHGLHVVQHVVFMATGVIMWWPILSPGPLPDAAALPLRPGPADVARRGAHYPRRARPLPVLRIGTARVGPRASRRPAARRPPDVGRGDDLPVGRGQCGVVPVVRTGRIR